MATGIKVGTITTNASGEGEFTGLLKDKYKLQETVAPDGFKLLDNPVIVNISDFGTNKVAQKTIVNEPAISTEKIHIPVKKQWVGKATDSVTVKLFADTHDTGKIIILNEIGQWKGSFNNLLKYDGVDGHKINYTIKEVAIPNYSSKITGNMDSGFVIKNTNNEKMSIPVVKQWVGKPAGNVKVKLFADNTEKETTTLTASKNWKHVFKNLPKYNNQDGHEIAYTVKEVKVNGYTTGISGTAKDGFTITNTVKGKVSVPVTKKWVGVRTDSITVNLYADGNKIDSRKLSKNNKWQHAFQLQEN